MNTIKRLFQLDGELKNVTTKMEALKIQNIVDLPDTRSISHVYEKIFSQLDKESLLCCSLVCDSWNECIAKSLKLMEKLDIVVNFSKGAFTEDDAALFSRTNRLFNKITIKHFIEPSQSLEALLHRNKWKSIKLKSQFIPFPDISDASLENLTVLEAVTFKLSHVLNIIKASPNLKELKLVVTDGSKDDWKCLTEREDQNLKLRKFALALNRCASSDAGRVNDFLQSQSSTLNELEVQGIVISTNTLRIISKMPNLEVFTLKKSFYEIRIEDVKLFEMKTLKTLKIFDDKFVDQRIFFPILKMARNITRIEVNELYQSRIEVVGRLKNLQEIVTRTIEFLNINEPSWFSSLRFIKVRQQMQKVQQERIAKMVQGDLTNFKVCLYEEMSKSPHSKVPHVVFYLNHHSEFD